MGIGTTKCLYRAVGTEEPSLKSIGNGVNVKAMGSP
jgi:hypothetical protein